MTAQLERMFMFTAPIKIHFFEDLSVGMHESSMHTVTSADVVRFATLSGDHNPIHLSEHFARKTRFGGRIAHGLYTASLISAVLGMYLPGPGAVYLSQTLNFRAPVRIGDVVTVIVQVSELIEQGYRCKLSCECIVDGKVVLDGEALVMVPARNPVRRAPVASPAPVKAASKTKAPTKKAAAKKQPAKRPAAKKSVSKKAVRAKRAKP
jgi:3-hydroxybutyryl-CoA dehydratase